MLIHIYAPLKRVCFVQMISRFRFTRTLWLVADGDMLFDLTREDFETDLEITNTAHMCVGGIRNKTLISYLISYIDSLL